MRSLRYSLPFLCCLLAGCHPTMHQKNRSKSHDSERANVQKEVEQERYNPPHFQALTALPRIEEKARFVPQKAIWPKSFEVLCSFDLVSETKPTEALNLLIRHFGLPLTLDPLLETSSGLTYYAHRKPLFQIIEDLCRLCQWRFVLTPEGCHLMPDKPYLETYNVQFLLGSRKTNNQVAIGTELLSGNRETNPSSDANTTTVKTEMNSDFWTELEENLKVMLQPSTPEALPGRYSLHKYAGLLTLCGTQNQHQLVKQYIERLQKLISTQVLIEAKIVEVELFKEYNQGIDWAGFNPLQALHEKQGLEKFKTVGLNVSTLQKALGFFEKFGKIKTLSNPRLLVLNNQTAILKVVENKIFYNLKNETRYVGADARPLKELMSQFETIPVGLLLVVQPSVVQSSDTGPDVFLSFRPTLSKVISYVPDPAVALNLSHHKTIDHLSQIHKNYAGAPQIQSKGVDSFVLLKNGETIAVGGLLEELQDHKNQGVPQVSRLPIVGSAFGKSTKEHRISELVIFIKVTVLTH